MEGLNKEKILLLSALVLCGGLYLLHSGGRPPSARVGRAKERKPSALDLPASLFPLPPGKEGKGRDLFLRPSESEPLPPLALEPPPMDPLPVVAPVPVPGPGPEGYQILLVPGAVGSPPAQPGEEPGKAAQPAGEEGKQGETASPAGGEAQPSSSPGEAPSEAEKWKKQYDWILLRRGGIVYGFITNPDRFDLKLPLPKDKEIRIQAVSPRTGKSIGLQAFPGRLVAAFGFADTVPNWIELTKRRLHGGKAYAEERRAFIEELLQKAEEHPKALEEARVQASLLVQDAPEEPTTWIAQAHVFSKAGDLENEYLLYKKLMADPAFKDRAFVHLGLARVYARLTLYGAAEAEFKRAYQLERSNWEVLLGMGTYLLDRGRAAEALTYLRRSVQFAPADAEKRFRCRYQAARALLALGRLDEASKEVETARAAGFQSPLLDLLQGILLLCSGKPRDALDPLGRALDALPDRAEPGLALGIAQGLAGDKKQAFQTLEAAGLRDPLIHSRTLGAHAWFQRKEGLPSDALDTARKALQEAPDDPFLLYLVARLQRENGDPEGARVPLSELLSRYQAVPAFLVEFALVEMENQNLRKARELVERALEGAGSSAPPVWLDLKGDILLLLHRLNEAYDTFLLSKKRNRSPHARIGLAQVAYYKGDIQECLDLLQAILNDYPEKSFWAGRANELRNRISYHAQLEQVVDDFQRARLGAGRWRSLRQSRAVPRIEEGWLVMKGVLDRDRNRKPLAVVRENEAPGRFVSVEVDCKILPGNQCDRVGLRIGVARTIGRGFRKELDPEVSVYWDNERGCGMTLVRGNGITQEKDRKPSPVSAEAWKEGEPARLRIEYGAEPGEGPSNRAGIPKVRIFAGGTLVREIQLPGMGRSRGDLEILLFAEGRPGETVQAAFDNFRLVRKKEGV